MVADAEAFNPAPFTALHVIVVPAVSALRSVGVQPVDDAMPDSGSVTDHVIVTSLRYQPLLPAVPEANGVITGGVVSAGVAVTTAMLCTLPAAIAAARWISVRTGTFRSFSVPSPSWPLPLLPHAQTSPFDLNAKLCEMPPTIFVTPAPERAAIGTGMFR